MTNSGAAGGTYSGDSRYTAAVYVSRAGTIGNASAWYWEFYANKASGTGYVDYDPQPWAVNVGGQAFSGARPMDWRGGPNTLILIASGYTNYIPHDADGNLYLSFSASASSASVGYAGMAGAFLADRIPRTPYSPPAPTFLSATSSVLNFSLAPPSDNGGSGIIDYYMELETYPAGVVIQSRSSSASSQTFTGLDPFTQYRLRYAARNGIGTGPWSPYTVANTAVGLPSAPLTLSVSDTGPTSATLNWLAPANNGGAAISNYRITRALDAGFALGVSQFTQGNVLSRAFADLAPSTSYYFKVEAANSAGYGPASTVFQVTTVSGCYYSNGSAWIPAGVFVSNGTDWIPAELRVSNGTTYIAAI